MTRTKLINMVVVGQGQAAAIFPTIIIAPRYFAGKVQLGQMFQTVEAFSQVLDSLSWIVNSYTNLANWRAIVERLATFHRAIVVARAAAAHGLILSPTPGDTVRLDDVTLTLPNGSALLQHTDLVLKQGTSIVVTGRSGSGKSTLFRALAGIWPFGDGRVERPVERCMFLPQRPYIPLGTLRHVITYPHPNNAYTREAITHALQDAGLGQFVPRLEHDDAWAQHLSGGEQQRVALARALLAKPDWLFLDEATANLDPESEAALYRTLKTRLPGTTLVSIAHRPSVAQFHDRRIVFQREEGKPGHLLLTELASAAEGGG